MERQRECVNKQGVYIYIYVTPCFLNHYITGPVPICQRNRGTTFFFQMPRYAIGIPKRQKKHTKNRKSKRGQPPSILHVHTPPIENNKASKASRHGVRHWPARSQPNRAAESTRGAVSLCPRSAQREPPSLPAGRQVGKRLLTGVATCRQHGSPCGDAHTHAMQARRCSRRPFSFRAPLTIFSE
jgi:hypothetical protein